MKSAKSIPPAQAERAMKLADELDSSSSEQSALSNTLRDELELTGESPKDFVAGLEGLMAKQQMTLAALAELAATDKWQR